MDWVLDVLVCIMAGLILYEDIKFLKVKNRNLLILLGISIGSVIYKVILGQSIIDNFVGGASSFLFLLAVGLMTMKSDGTPTVGGGDIKLVAILGLYFGYDIMKIVLLGACACAFVISGGLVFLRKKSTHTLIPFASFLAGVSVFAIVVLRVLTLYNINWR